MRPASRRFSLIDDDSLAEEELEEEEEGEDGDENDVEEGVEDDVEVDNSSSDNESESTGSRQSGSMSEGEQHLLNLVLSFSGSERRYGESRDSEQGMRRISENLQQQAYQQPYDIGTQTRNRVSRIENLSTSDILIELRKETFGDRLMIGRQLLETEVRKKDLHADRNIGKRKYKRRRKASRFVKWKELLPTGDRVSDLGKEFNALSAVLPSSEPSLMNEVTEESEDPIGWVPSLDPEFVAVDRDRRTARYCGMGHVEKFFSGRVVANKPLDRNHRSLEYFEVRIGANNATCNVTIGVHSRKGLQESSMDDVGGLAVGHYVSSVGICGRTGVIWSEGEKDTGAPRFTFGSDDVVGCGVDREDGIIFFTLNGAMRGKLALPKRLMGEDLYPCVTLQNLGESIHAQFHPPFAFPVDKINLESKFRKENPVSKVHVSVEDMRSLVTEYLSFHGYSQTADALKRDQDRVGREDDLNFASQLLGKPKRNIGTIFSSGFLENAEWMPTNTSQYCVDSLGVRASIRRLLVTRQPLALCEFLQCQLSHIDQVPTEYRVVEEILKQQHFVELIRENKPTEALAFAREEFSSDVAPRLLPLLGYSDPERSPYKSLFNPERYESIFCAVLEILDLIPCSSSGVEKEENTSEEVKDKCILEQRSKLHRSALDIILSHRISCKLSM